MAFFVAFGGPLSSSIHCGLVRYLGAGVFVRCIAGLPVGLLPASLVCCGSRLAFLWGYCRALGLDFGEDLAAGILTFGSTIGPSRDRGEMAMAGLSLLPLFRAQHVRCCSFYGAPGHNRWGVAETPLPAKSQGRNMDCLFTLLSPSAVVRCILRAGAPYPRKARADCAESVVTSGVTSPNSGGGEIQPGSCAKARTHWQSVGTH